jgi:hypothetical protein
MSPLLSRWQVFLVVVALAASWALLTSPSAAAQTPTELWEEYPLAPETDPAQSGNDGEEPREERGDGAPAPGDESDAAAADEDSSPLLGITLTLGVLLLVLAFGMGVHPRDWRMPKGLRERFSGLWEPSPLYAAADVPRRAPPGSVSKTSVGAKRSNGADVVKKPSSPAKAKRLPIPKKPPAKPAKPAGAVKPQRISKPPRSGKPSEVAKPPGALKLPKPAPAAKPGPSARVKAPSKAPTPRRTRSPSHRAELRPVDEQSPPAADPLPTGRTVTCSIFGWRDGEVADFYAVAFGLQGLDWIVERSPRFLWPAGDVPDEAYEAHATLVDSLVRAGWRPTGYEGAWYRQRFERAIEPVSERP